MIVTAFVRDISNNFSADFTLGVYSSLTNLNRPIINDTEFEGKQIECLENNVTEIGNNNIT